MAKLELSELGLRTRMANQRRSARLVERQKAAGKVALTVWVSATTKARVDAARHGATWNEVAERLLLAGLDATTPDAPAASAVKPTAAELTADLFEAPAGNATPATRDNPPVYTVEGGGRDALMTEVGKLLNEGHTGADVARRLAAAGYRSPNGAALAGGNLLRDYRAWLKKAGAAVAPRV